MTELTGQRTCYLSTNVVSESMNGSQPIKTGIPSITSMKTSHKNLVGLPKYSIQFRSLCEGSSLASLWTQFRA